MKREPYSNRLLDDILEEVTPPEFRAGLLTDTLKQVRRRQHLRQWKRGSLAAALMAAAGFLVLRSPAHKGKRNEVTPAVVNIVSSGTLSPSEIVASDPTSVQIIASEASPAVIFQTGSYNSNLRVLDDEELLALLGGKPALLVRQGPQQAELFVVDSTGKAVQPAEEPEERRRGHP